MIILALLILAIVAWIVLTWWNTPDSVTFKAVVQNALRDVRDICAPALRLGKRIWWFFGPRVTNLVAVSVVSVDAYIVQTPDLKDAIMQTQWGLAVLVALNLAATLSPKNAPERLPS